MEFLIRKKAKDADCKCVENKVQDILTFKLDIWERIKFKVALWSLSQFPFKGLSLSDAARNWCLAL